MGTQVRKKGRRDEEYEVRPGATATSIIVLPWRSSIANKKARPAKVRQDGLTVLNHGSPGVNGYDLREPLPYRVAALEDVLPWAFTAGSYRPRLTSPGFSETRIGVRRSGRRHVDRRLE
jgi:hypothetical protein